MSKLLFPAIGLFAQGFLFYLIFSNNDISKNRLPASSTTEPRNTESNKRKFPSNSSLLFKEGRIPKPVDSPSVNSQKSVGAQAKSSQASFTDYGINRSLLSNKFIQLYSDYYSQFIMMTIDDSGNRTLVLYVNDVVGYVNVLTRQVAYCENMFFNPFPSAIDDEAVSALECYDEGSIESEFRYSNYTYGNGQELVDSDGNIYYENGQIAYNDYDDEFYYYNGQIVKERYGYDYFYDDGNYIWDNSASSAYFFNGNRAYSYGDLKYTSSTFVDKGNYISFQNSTADFLRYNYSSNTYRYPRSGNMAVLDKNNDLMTLYHLDGSILKEELPGENNVYDSYGVNRTSTHTQTVYKSSYNNGFVLAKVNNHNTLILFNEVDDYGSYIYYLERERIPPPPPPAVSSLSLDKQGGSYLFFDWISGGGNTNAYYINFTEGTSALPCSDGERTTNSSKSYSNLELSTVYTFSVCAINNVGTFGAQRELTVTTKNTLVSTNTPSGLKVYSRSPTTLGIDWLSSNNNVLGYHVTKSLYPQEPPSCTEQVITSYSRYTHYRLKEQTRYNFRVCAISIDRIVTDSVLINGVTGRKNFRVTNVKSKKDRVEFTVRRNYIGGERNLIVKVCKASNPRSCRGRRIKYSYYGKAEKLIVGRLKKNTRYRINIILDKVTRAKKGFRTKRR